MVRYAEMGGVGLGGLSKESTEAGPWQAGQIETCMDVMCHSRGHHSLRRMSANAGRGWVLKHGVRRVDSGEEYCWLHRDSLKGWE